MPTVTSPIPSKGSGEERYTPPSWSFLEAFARPRATHHRSLLMRLLAEVRTQILRYLLKHDTSLTASVKQIQRKQSSGGWRSRLNRRQVDQERVPRIRHMSSKESGKSFRQRAHQLQPSILASCQQFLVEGSHVLYSENTLLLVMSVVDENHKERSHLSVPCAEDYLMYNTMNPSSYLSKMPQYVRNFVARFSRLELELDPDYAKHDLEAFSDSWYGMSHVFRQIGTTFALKEVQVSCTDKDVLEDEDFLNILEFLQYTRFAAITFVFTPVTPPVEVRQHIIDVVTSDTQIVDLHYYREKATEYLKAYQRFEPQGRCHELEGYEGQMSEHIVDFDVPEFKKAYEGFMKEYFELMEARLALQAAEVETDLTGMST